ncbi:MKRN2 opposite strand protein-like [Xylocopa sonorina]|uniref:MKRN2 opposite strand protein-like n=1 Tax=Xylocopa sonorina TaxID=1818115 RepID=UPI00403B3389
MTSESNILCFRHCCSRSMFCKSIPKICPICQSCIVDYKIEPFLVPYPYTNAIYEENSIVIRPSQGNFLNDYHITDDLHIGITNSQGIVFEYDKEGLVINDCSKWTKCIAIRLIPSSWDNHWNETLTIMLKDPKWRSDNYNESLMNCFNFVIEFLNNLKYTNLSFVNKETICEKLILPKIRDALKYNSVSMKLKTSDIFIS